MTDEELLDKIADLVEKRNSGEFHISVETARAMILSYIAEYKQQIIDELENLDCLGVYYDSSWGQVRETTSHPEYVKLEDLNRIINWLRKNETTK